MIHGPFPVKVNKISSWWNLPRNLDCMRYIDHTPFQLDSAGRFDSFCKLGQPSREPVAKVNPPNLRRNIPLLQLMFPLICLVSVQLMAKIFWGSGDKISESNWNKSFGSPQSIQLTGRDRINPLLDSKYLEEYGIGKVSCTIISFNLNLQWNDLNSNWIDKIIRMSYPYHLTNYQIREA